MFSCFQKKETIGQLLKKKLYFFFSRFGISNYLVVCTHEKAVHFLSQRGIKTFLFLNDSRSLQSSFRDSENYFLKTHIKTEVTLIALKAGEFPSLSHLLNSIYMQPSLPKNVYWCIYVSCRHWYHHGWPRYLFLQKSHSLSAPARVPNVRSPDSQGKPMVVQHWVLFGTEQASKIPLVSVSNDEFFAQKRFVVRLIWGQPKGPGHPKTNRCSCSRRNLTVLIDCFNVETFLGLFFFHC